MGVEFLVTYIFIYIFKKSRALFNQELTQLKKFTRRLIDSRFPGMN